MKTPLDHELPDALADLERYARNTARERDRLRAVLAAFRLVAAVALGALSGSVAACLTDYATRMAGDPDPVFFVIGGAVFGALGAVAAMVHLRDRKGGSK